ncbi:MAG: hypothetical protein ACOYI8_07680 [Christensenellales bacterium]|jgi:cell division protein FtsL
MARGRSAGAAFAPQPQRREGHLRLYDAGKRRKDEPQSNNVMIVLSTVVIVVAAIALVTRFVALYSAIQKVRTLETTLAKLESQYEMLEMSYTEYCLNESRIRDEANAIGMISARDESVKTVMISRR